MKLTRVPGAEPVYDENGAERVNVLTCGYCEKSWNDAAVSGRTPVPSGRCPFEDDHFALASEVGSIQIITDVCLYDDGFGDGGEYFAVVVINPIDALRQMDLVRALGHITTDLSSMTYAAAMRVYPGSCPADLLDFNEKARARIAWAERVVGENAVGWQFALKHGGVFGLNLGLTREDAEDPHLPSLRLSEYVKESMEDEGEWDDDDEPVADGEG